jgi:archaeosortase A (PGF-CTERM-specific)
MSSAWLLSDILWFSLTLLLASALSSKTRPASLGWALFGVYWMGQPGHYIAIEDYFNATLTVAASLFCLYLAWIILTYKSRSQAFTWASYAAAVCGIIYFPFAEVYPLQTWLIGFTTLITAQSLHVFYVPVVMESWNTLVLNGRTVEIILACTAIESIALFAGVIVSVKAPLRRRLAALLASTLTIYVLNIVRNSFVLMAYGWDWFGSDSFHVAHNIIAKAGSTVALLAIAYLVFALLPELLTVIDELATEIKHPGGPGGDAA